MNGVLVEENSDRIGSIYTGPEPLLIAFPPPSDDNRYEVFQGSMDDIRIYNRALSSVEVQGLYACEFPDADKDGLNDSEELNVYHTDPNKKDTDGDGLNDFQEIRVRNTNPLVPDSDGDGYNDYAEVYSGKNPLDVNDHPPASLSAFTAIELEFVSKANAAYFIQASPDLITWTNYEGPIVGDGNIWKKTYTTRDSGKLYYRVELAP